MSRRKLVALVAATSACLVVRTRLHAQLPPLVPQNVRPALQLSDDSVLVCEVGGLLGGGSAKQETEVEVIPLKGQERRAVIVEFVARLDRNRDRQLDHRELLALDLRTRQQALDQMDTNLDRMLERSEIEEAIIASDPALADYPQPEQPPTIPAQPETFRNLRRYGIGLRQNPPTARSQPFERAATFGTSPGFSRTVTKRDIDARFRPSSGGGCTITFRRAR